MENLILSQGLEHVDPAAGEQRRNDFKRRIFRGGADQTDVALLHVGQKCILLCFIETMDLVNKNDGARAVLPGPFSVRHDLLYFLDPGQHGGKLNELRLGHVCDDLRQSGLARAWWSPEDERAGIVAFDLSAQRFAGRHQVFLPDKFIQRARTHTVGQRTAGISRFICRRDGLEKVHGNC